MPSFLPEFDKSADGPAGTPAFAITVDSLCCMCAVSARTQSPAPLYCPTTNARPKNAPPLCKFTINYKLEKRTLVLANLICTYCLDVDQ